MKIFFQPLFLLLPLFHQALAAPVPDALAKASPVATDSSIVPREADVFQDLLDILKGVEANNTKRAAETEAEPIPILLEPKDALSVGGLIGSLNGILNGLPKINIKRDANANAEALDLGGLQGALNNIINALPNAGDIAGDVNGALNGLNIR